MEEERISKNKKKPCYVRKGPNNSKKTIGKSRIEDDRVRNTGKPNITVVRLGRHLFSHHSRPSNLLVSPKKEREHTCLDPHF
jgi:hypothetical protein